MKNLILLAASFFALSFLFSCATVPISGRPQANFGGRKYYDKEAATEYRRLISSSRLCEDVEKVQLVRRVSNKIIDAANRYYTQNGLAKKFNSFKWEINLIDEPIVNAYCMPGGKIAVYTGIMSIMENEDQLAAVIGHEVSHALALHTCEKMSHKLMAELGQIGVQVATANKSAETRQLADAGYAVGATLGFLLPYSRKLEKEADQIGLRLMIMAGYDPNEAARFWERNIEEFGDAKTGFFNTHPTHRTRKQEILAQIPQAIEFAKPYLEKSDTPTEPQPVMVYQQPVSTELNEPNSKSIDMPSSAQGFVQNSNAAASKPEGLNYLTIQVETVSNYERMAGEYTTLETIGKVHVEKALIEGETFDRVQLGHFDNEGLAQAALEKVRRKGFKNAFLVEYKNGTRSKWLR